MTTEREQCCELYIAGMANDSIKAVDKVNSRIAEGWLVEHIFSLPSSTLIVVYARQKSIKSPMPVGGYLNK